MVVRRATTTSSDTISEEGNPNPQLAELLAAVRVLQDQNLVQQQRNEEHQRLQDEAQTREAELRMQLEERECEHWRNVTTLISTNTHTTKYPC
jgi:hypothetical protein